MGHLDRLAIHLDRCAQSVLLIEKLKITAELLRPFAVNHAAHVQGGRGPLDARAVRGEDHILPAFAARGGLRTIAPRTFPAQ